jgi:putative oxidoreductase
MLRQDRSSNRSTAIMSVQKPDSTSSWLTYTDGIAAQWQDLLMLVARIMIGLIFVMSSWGKLMNISGFVATMPPRGLPVFLGYVAPFVEFIGGILLMSVSPPVTRR